MKRLLVIMAVLVVVALLALVVLPYFARAKAYSGPGIYGNLRYIQSVKDQWAAAVGPRHWTPRARAVWIWMFRAAASASF